MNQYQASETEGLTKGWSANAVIGTSTVTVRDAVQGKSTPRMIHAVQVSEGKSPRMSALAAPLLLKGVAVETSGGTNPVIPAGLNERSARPTLGALASRLASIVASQAQPSTQPKPPQVLS